jgi:hypothetical protein
MRYGVVIGLVSLMLQVQSASACDRIEELHALDQIQIEASEVNLGDILIGVDYDRDENTRYLHLKKSGCYKIKLRDIRNRDQLDVWIANDKYWNDEYRGMFALVQTLRVVKHASSTSPFKENISFHRNSNEAPDKVAWHDGRGDLKVLKPDVYQSKFTFPIADRHRLLSISDREKFDKEVPDFLRYLVEKDNSSLSARYDAWTYLSRSYMTENFVRKVEVNNLVYATMRTRLYKFKTRSDKDKRLIRDPLFLLNIDGQCHYLNIDGPYEEFHKSIILKLENADINCPSG